MELKCSSKNGWANVLKNEINNSKNNLLLKIDDKHQLHNLIYYLLALESNKDLKLYIEFENGINKEDTIFEISTLFYLTKEAKDSFINEKLPNYKCNFKKTIPFLIFTSSNKNKLNVIDDNLKEYLIDNMDKNLKYSNDNTINLIVEIISYNYKIIMESLKENDELKNEIDRTFDELNLLAILIFFYTISEEYSYNIIEIRDLKREIRNLSIGLYQIIENSVIHSEGKKAYVYISKLDILKRKSYKKISTFNDHNKNLLYKKLSFMDNFNFQLNEKYYIFIRVIDDIRRKETVTNELRTKNIIDSIGEKLNEKKVEEEKNNQNYNNIITALYSLLSKNNTDIIIEKESENVSNNYGLITFLNAANNLNMQFLFNSGNESFLYTDYQFEKNKNFYDKLCEINNLVTEYSCVFPVESTIRKNNNIYNNIEVELYNLELLKTDEIFIEKSFNPADDKKTRVNKIYNKILAVLDEDEQVISINIQSIENTEVLVKAISNLLYKCILQNKKVFISIDFVDENKTKIYSKLSEFLQYLKICNIKLCKILGNKKYENSDYQIAFYHRDNNKSFYITTMVGIEWNVMVCTFINNLLYENDINKLEYFNIYIDDFNNNGSNNEYKIKVLPFQNIDSNNIDFIEKIKKIIVENNDHNVKNNVLLGSGLYLRDFYEAENVFHNKYLMMKVALMIKKDLDKKPDLVLYDKIYIVGYANYSHILCEEIKKQFQEKEKIEIIYVPNINDGELICNNNLVENSIVISILPIGSTLYTLFKMNQYFRNYFKLKENKYFFNENYCILLVGRKNNEFWDVGGRIEQFTKISMKYGDIIVKNLIGLETEWDYSPGDDLAISHVDKTSTLPLTIYETQQFSNSKGIDKENLRKVKQLNNMVKYGHFCLDNNHYLFYINHTRFLKKYFNEIEKDLKKRNTDINKIAYNIVVSPLNNNNSFLNLVIDKVFSGNATIVHFDSFLTLREQFIYKYKFVIESIKKIFETSNNTNVKIYYVDNTITSGRTINRAKELVRALLSTVKDLNKDNRIPERIFEKVYIIINRCSNNTLDTIVGDETNVYSYIKLNCPSFDTTSNECPDCKISKNYNKLYEMTTNNDLALEFKTKADKHSLKYINNIDEHEYNKEDFIRLCVTHIVLEKKQELFMIYDNYIEKEEYIYEKLNLFVSEIKELLDDENEKISLEDIISSFIKVISRPFVTMYEKIKQLGYKYIKILIEDELKKVDIKNEYIELLLERISYFGTSYLRENMKMLNDLINRNLISEKFKSRIITFETAIARGIIK